MNKINLISTITFVGLCSVLTGCGVLMSGDGSTASNSTSKNGTSVSVNSVPKDVSTLIGISPLNSTSAKNQARSTANSASKGVPVDKAYGKNTSSESSVHNNGHYTASSSASSSKKSPSSSFQGMTVAEQNKLDAQANAQAMQKVIYQDTHNPNFDGQNSSQHAGLTYKGTSSNVVIGNITSNTIQLKPGQTFTINTNPNSTNYGNYTIGGK